MNANAFRPGSAAGNPAVRGHGADRCKSQMDTTSYQLGDRLTFPSRGIPGAPNARHPRARAWRMQASRLAKKKLSWIDWSRVTLLGI